LSEVGKKIRLKRIFRDNGKTLIVAMDHGMGGAIPSLERPLEVVQKVAAGGADAVLITLGILKQFYSKIPRDIGLVLSIPPDPRYIEIAVKAGVHAVKNTFFGSLRDRERLGLLGPLAVECEKWGMPLLAEIVPTDIEKGKRIYKVQEVKNAARIGAEFGADIIKTSYTGSAESFKEVVETCPIPITILGGAKMDTDREVLEIVKGVVDAGGSGVCFGRNIFQHRDPTAITRAIAKIIHEQADVEEASKELARL